MRAVLWSRGRHLSQHGAGYWAGVLHQPVEHAVWILQQGAGLVKLLDLWVGVGAREAQRKKGRLAAQWLDSKHLKQTCAV